MGSAQSANGRRLFPLLPSSNRYQRLPHSSPSLKQPLLQQDQNLFTDIEHEVQAYGEKSSALEKEICGLKSKFSGLETMVQTLQSRPTSETKGIEVEKQEAMKSLKEKVDNLKKSLDGEIVRRESDKRVYSAAFSNQGLAFVKVEKEIAELKSRVDEMTSTMVEFAAVIAELKLRPKEALESTQIEKTDVENIKVSKEGLFFILIFLIGVLIGLNL